MKKKLLLLCVAAVIVLSGCQSKEKTDDSGNPSGADGNAADNQLQADVPGNAGEEAQVEYERDSSPGQILPLTLEEMRQMIDEDQSFAIVFTKEECPYCIEFMSIFEPYIQTHNVTMYEVNLTAEDRSQNDNKMIIQTYFPEFNTVPGVFSVKDGEEESYLNLYQLGMDESVIDQWVQEYQLDAAG